jgi:hypothetical protein
MRRLGIEVFLSRYVRNSSFHRIVSIIKIAADHTIQPLGLLEISMPDHLSRRLLVCCAALLTCAAPAWAAPAADAWPSQPLKIMVGFAAGGANDIVARILAKELQQRLGQSVVWKTAAARAA